MPVLLGVKGLKNEILSYTRIRIKITISSLVFLQKRRSGAPLLFCYIYFLLHFNYYLTAILRYLAFLSAWYKEDKFGIWLFLTKSKTNTEA